MTKAQRKEKLYTVPEMATAVGVSKARAYQRVSGKHAKRGTGTPLAHLNVRKGHPTGRGRGIGQGVAHILIPESVVQSWRNERILAGRKVGCLLGPND